MKDLAELLDFMENNHNFTLWSTNYNGDTKEYQFLSRDVEKERVINCIVNLEEKTFQFKFLIPYTVFTLNSGKFSPITDKTHFHKNYRRFMKQVDILLEGNAI